jgi:hypothetical protein
MKAGRNPASELLGPRSSLRETEDDGMGLVLIRQSIPSNLMMEFYFRQAGELRDEA